MGHYDIYIALLAVIAVVSILFRNSSIPSSLLLVIAGMLISFLPGIPYINVDPKFILDIFLPLLLYEASAYSSSWKDFKYNLRPIALLSIGHVIFITMLVAVTIHSLIPEFGWPLAFVLGAVISPPDDVAILAIAERIQIPSRLVTILKGEAMLNDATALIIYRFALAAFITHEFSIMTCTLEFFAIIIIESIYGFAVGTIVGELRLRINNSILQMLLSILTPFIVYLPAKDLGGSGVVATVVTGMVIGYSYWARYPADVRLTARSIWETLSYGVQSVLFLLVGLNFNYTLQQITYIPLHSLMIYSTAIVLIVIVGRFAWVYPATYLPRFLFSAIRHADPYPPWQAPFVVSWAGMRGGISLAAALAVPILPPVNGINPRDLLIFLVFCVIIATLLIQGLSLPCVVKALGLDTLGEVEQTQIRHSELLVHSAMINAALRWLMEYELKIQENDKLTEQVRLRINEYQTREIQICDRIKNSNTLERFEENAALKEEIFLLSQLIEIERKELLFFWQKNKIDLATKNKLEMQLDLRTKQIAQIS